MTPSRRKYPGELAIHRHLGGSKAATVIDRGTGKSPGGLFDYRVSSNPGHVGVVSYFVQEESTEHVSCMIFRRSWTMA